MQLPKQVKVLVTTKWLSHVAGRGATALAPRSAGVAGRCSPRAHLPVAAGHEDTSKVWRNNPIAMENEPQGQQTTLATENEPRLNPASTFLCKNRCKKIAQMQIKRIKWSMAKGRDAHLSCKNPLGQLLRLEAFAPHPCYWRIKYLSKYPRSRVSLAVLTAYYLSQS